MASRQLRLIVNGEEHSVPCADSETLLTVLRERLQLTGTKLGCGRGECGACTVLVDGRLAYSCLALAAGCDNTPITTVEGLGSPDTLHPLQQAFIEHDALQCGFCTPGQLMAGGVLLRHTPPPPPPPIRPARSGRQRPCAGHRGRARG